MSIFSCPARRLHLGAGQLLSTLMLVALAAGAPLPAPAQDAVMEVAAPTVTPAAPWTWSGPVPVARLVAAARAAHPTVLAVAAARAAAEARVRQASAWANPELELALGQTRPRVDGLDPEQPYGGSLKQRLEWWGVRSARVAAAQAQLSAAEAAGRVALLELEAEVRLAAIAYAAAAVAAAQDATQADLMAELATVAASRLAAGDLDRASAARIRLEAATSALHRDARRREADTALAVLRTWCDQDLPAGLVVADAWTDQPLDLDPQRLREAASRHPRLLALAEVVTAAESQVASARSSRLPDLTVGVYAGREYEKDTYGLTLGIDVPLWNWNRGGIAEAEAERAQARAMARSERQRLQRDLLEALGAVTTAQVEARALAEQAAPVAAEVLALRMAAFKAGEAGLADLLEARRASLAVASELGAARRRAAEALIRLGQAVGEPSLGMTQVGGLP